MKCTKSQRLYVENVCTELHLSVIFFTRSVCLKVTNVLEMSLFYSKTFGVAKIPGQTYFCSFDIHLIGLQSHKRCKGRTVSKNSGFKEAVITLSAALLNITCLYWCV